MKSQTQASDTRRGYLIIAVHVTPWNRQHGIKSYCLWAEEMAQQVKIFAARPEDLGSFDPWVPHVGKRD